MSVTRWILTLSAVLTLFQRQSMSVNGAITCPALPAPSNGTRQGCSGTTTESYNTVCQFSCSAGFNGYGSPSRKCQQDGTWSGQVFHCQEIPSPSTKEEQGIPKIVYPAVVVGFLVVIALIVIRVFCLRERCHANRWPKSNDRGRSYTREEYMEIRAVQLRDIGFHNPHFDPESHYQSLDNARGRTYSVCLGFKNTQSKTGNEINQNLLNSSDRPIQLQLLASFPEYITRAENTFSSDGGNLCAISGSDVSIVVDSGTIPVGIEQRIFFGVIYNETALVQDVPKAPAMTLISPVIECGPHDIKLSKPVKIIVPHCLDLSKAKKEWVTVYRCERFPGHGKGLSWEKVSNEWDKSSQSKAWFKVKQDSIHIITKTFSFWSIFACGGPRRKRATVFASKSDPQNDRIYLRFYVYSDNEDSRTRIEKIEAKLFPGSRSTREKPFKMYNDNQAIKVQLTDLEEGWVLDRTADTQIYNYERGNRNRFRAQDACDFAVKPEEGRDVNGFSCYLSFRQEDHLEEYKIFLDPGFTPLKRSADICRSDAASSSTVARGRSSYSASAKEEDVDYNNHNQEGNTLPDSSRGWTVDFSSLGRDNEPVTERHFGLISHKVGASWKNVLRKLFLDEPTIENLKEDYYKADERFYQGLMKWKNGAGSREATTKKLCDALRQAGCREALKALSTLHLFGKEGASDGITSNTLHLSEKNDAPNSSDR